MFICEGHVSDDLLQLSEKRHQILILLVIDVCVVKNLLDFIKLCQIIVIGKFLQFEMVLVIVSHILRHHNIFVDSFGQSRKSWPLL